MIPTPPLFDRYVMVDWSANSRPKSKKDSIWICSLGRTDHDHDVVENPRTRVLSRERVRTLLAESVERHERVLVGFDFPYGYPRGFAAAVGLSGAPWRATWDFFSSRIEDASNN